MDRRRPKGVGRQFGFAASAAAGALAGAAASGVAGRAPPVKRSITERTASRVLRSLTAVEQWRRGRRAADQAFRIRKDQGIVPRALHHERQVEGRARARRRGQAGDALEIVFAGRHRRGAGQGEARGRAFDADVLGGGDAVGEFHRDGQVVVGRRAAAEIAAAGQRPALQPLEQLLDIEAGDGAVMAGQRRGAVERVREAERARARGHQRDVEIAAAGQLVDAEQFAGAGLQVDIGELELGLDVGDRVRARDAERALGDAAIHLRLADAERQRAAAQIGAERGAAEFGRADRDPRRRQPHVEVGGRQRVEVEQLPVPVARAAGEQAEGGDVGREIECAGGQRRLQRLAAVIGVGHHAFGDIAVEFDIDIGQRDRRADDIGARLQREAAEAAAAGRRLPGPAQRVAQRQAVDGQRAFHHHAGAVGDGAVEGQFQRRAGQPRLQAGAVARQRRDEIAGADRAVDALAAPVELPGGGKGARDRRPGQRQVDVAELFGDVVGGVLIGEHAVLDPDFRERHLVLGAGLHGARDGLDERRPVALAIAVADDMDMRPQHHHVGDFEPLQQQRQQPQIRGQHVDLERGVGGAAALQPDVMKRDVAARKYRDIDRAR